MSKYAGTQTEKNLESAFAGESQARNKYTYFASKAKKEGFEQISALFLKTADTSWAVRPPRGSALSAPIPRLILRSARKITKYINPNPWRSP